MGLFSFSDQELADQAIETARSATDGDGRFFAYRVRSGVGLKNDPDVLLSAVINGVTGLGWQLHSVVPYINTIGPNNEVTLVVFERR